MAPLKKAGLAILGMVVLVSIFIGIAVVYVVISAIDLANYFFEEEVNGVFQVVNHDTIDTCPLGCEHKEEV